MNKLNLIVILYKFNLMYRKPILRGNNQFNGYTHSVILPVILTLLSIQLFNCTYENKINLNVNTFSHTCRERGFGPSFLVLIGVSSTLISSSYFSTSVL